MNSHEDFFLYSIPSLRQVFLLVNCFFSNHLFIEGYSRTLRSAMLRRESLFQPSFLAFLNLLSCSCLGFKTWPLDGQVSSAPEGHCLSSAAVINYHRLGGLNSGHLRLTVLEAEKSTIKVPAGLLPGLQTIVLSLYPHVVGRKKTLLCLL